MQLHFFILTLLRNDAPRDAIQRIQRHFRGLTFGLNPLNGLNALTKRNANGLKALNGLNALTKKKCPQYQSLRCAQEVISITALCARDNINHCAVRKR